jgi:hypothetical protein
MVNYFERANDSDSDSEFEYEVQSDSDIDEIYDEEDIDHAEKQNSKYYIGITKLIRPYNYYLLLNSISSASFFRYPHKTILNYLIEYSIIESYKPKIDILKLVIVDDTYTVIKKTFWLRLVQRHWRNVVKARRNIYLRRCSIVSLRNFEITGKFPIGLRSLPGLYGMMSAYC